ncbi:hypothetical protein F4777DRAFT_565724 [Nemania sp. FL0916]|nr:hypothetical protein F4777DRAFT_565724 [Nemania sp. FL0916]
MHIFFTTLLYVHIFLKNELRVLELFCSALLLAGFVLGTYDICSKSATGRGRKYHVEIVEIKQGSTTTQAPRMSSIRFRIPFKRSSRRSSTTASPAREPPIGPSVITTIEDARVDVVFVHGLTGHREKTWTAEGETDPWPKSLLPKDLPTARIILYGYDADVLHLTRVVGQNTIRDHARALINDLKPLRREAKRRPIIFVVHSLGGLVVQDALVICNNPIDEADGNIVECTRGVVFLGTPHRGAGLAEFAASVVNVISLVKLPNKKLLEVLNKNSDILANITEGFLNLVTRRNREKDSQGSLKPIGIHCFTEEKPVEFLEKLVVERQSAKIDGYDFGSIPANHMNMTKYGVPSDPGYQRVMNKLKDWISDDARFETFTGPQYAQKLWALLGGECSQSEPPESAKQLCQSRDITDSLEWFLESSEYRAWASRVSTKLWLRGEPGDGKTVLITYILQDLSLDVQHGREYDFAAVFCSSEDSESIIIASLASQLLQKNNVRAHAAQMEFPITKFERCNDRDVFKQLLWGLLRLLAISEDNYAPLLVIDGLDKLSLSTRRSFLGGLNRIEEQDKKDAYMRVLISSQTQEDIKRALTHYLSIDREKERRECLKTLEFHEWNARENKVEDVQDGGSWLSTNREYKQWNESPESSILWLEGKPGSGKSTIVKLIVRELEKKGIDPSCSRCMPPDLKREKQVWIFDSPKDKSTIVARFYYSFRGGRTETDHKNMLQSIVYQIWRENSKLFLLIRSRYRELRRGADGERTQTTLWTYDDLKSVLHTLRETDFELNISILIDGMDESDSSKRTDILRFLPELVYKGNPCVVKVLVASRPEVDINAHLRAARSHHIQLQQVNREDIRLVVGKWIKKMESRRSSKPSGKEDYLIPVKDIILERAQGVFLWVTLVLKELEKNIVKGGVTPAALRQKVAKFPEELGGEEGFYRLMIKSLTEDNEDVALGRRILAWVLFTKKPLSVEELRDALATPLQADISGLQGYDLGDNRPEELDHGILTYCGGLVEVRQSKTDQIVQLVHQTARDFLLDQSNIAKPYHIDEIQGDMEIIGTCCRYLRIVFATTIPLTDAAPAFSLAKKLAKYLFSCKLLLYSLRYLTQHLDHLRSNKIERPPELEIYISELANRAPHESYAYLLLGQWIRTLNCTTPCDDIDGTNAALCALSLVPFTEGRDEIVQMLLVLQPNLAHFAAEHGRVDEIKRLLQAGWDSNARDAEGQTPLHLASQNGDNGVVKVLLDAGANPNAMCRNQRRPVHLAAQNSSSGLMWFLLKADAEINSRDIIGQTPLELVVRNENYSIQLDLLRAGADPNIEDSAGQALLHWATTRGDHTTMYHLLNRGANPDVKDGDGKTPLHVAIKRDDQETVSTLLDGGADPDVEDLAGQTPRQLAAEEGKRDMIEILEQESRTRRWAL